MENTSRSVPWCHFVNVPSLGPDMGRRLRDILVKSTPPINVIWYVCSYICSLIHIGWSFKGPPDLESLPFLRLPKISPTVVLCNHQTRCGPQRIDDIGSKELGIAMLFISRDVWPSWRITLVTWNPLRPARAYAAPPYP